MTAEALRARAAALGVAVRFEDLGDWSPCVLVSEYDPAGPVIRINLRAVAERDENRVARAIAHELYHHEESRGRLARLPSRAAREAAAQHFARRLIEGEA